MWEIGIKDIFDILIAACGMYWLYKRTKATGTFVVFQGIMVFMVVWLVVCKVLNMRLIGSILNGMMSVGFIAIIILCQNEIRQVLIRVGSRHQWTSIMRFFERSQVEKNDKSQWVDQIVLACRNMSAQKVGALICIQEAEDLVQYAKTGEEIDAVVSTRLIEQIFYKNTPLHDGAMIVQNGRIRAAACILPVSHSNGVPKEFGLRHRSALGLTEQTDAKVVIVSEETGAISMAWRGKFHRELTTTTLHRLLMR